MDIPNRPLSNSYLTMKKIIVVLLAFTVLASFAQTDKPEQAPQELRPFKTLSVFGPFDIQLIPSEKEGIEMAFKNTDEEDVTVTVKKDELIIKFKTTNHFFNDWDKNKFRKVPLIKTRIYYKQIERMDIKAGAQVSSQETFNAEKLIIESSMGAEVKLTVDCKSTYVKANMGAYVGLFGKTDFFEVNANMGSSISAARLICKSAVVKAHMGSEINFHATEEVDIVSSMGSSVRYTGNPTVKHTSRKMGSDISNR